MNPNAAIDCPSAPLKTPRIPYLHKGLLVVEVSRAEKQHTCRRIARLTCRTCVRLKLGHSIYPIATTGPKHGGVDRKRSQNQDSDQLQSVGINSIYVYRPQVCHLRQHMWNYIEGEEAVSPSSSGIPYVTAARRSVPGNVWSVLLVVNVAFRPLWSGLSLNKACCC